MKVIHEREYFGWRGRNGATAGDAKISWSHGDDGNENDRDGCETDEDVDENGKEIS